MANTRKPHYTPRYDWGGCINLWSSLDKANAYIDWRYGDISNALAHLLEVVGQQGIYIENLQRRLHALDSQVAPIHLGDLGNSDGRYIHPEMTPIDYRRMFLGNDSSAA
jgi:hypothetical protein